MAEMRIFPGMSKLLDVRQVTKWLTVLIFWFHCCDGVNVNIQNVISYYENLINANIQEAFLSPNLPLDASMFAPRWIGISEYGTYDYIVIGSGSAGAVIASRLTENPQWNVLLLEAGGPETDFSDIPNLHFYLQGLRFNWNYNTTRQTTCCLGNIDQKCAYPRGRVMGGTSTINGLVYSRGHAEDYNGWAAAGNVGWSYEDVLPLFMKSENSKVDGDEGYHGKDGYWSVEFPRPRNPILNAYIEAHKELGYRELDYNGREELGVSQSQMNNINGRRHTLSRAFLEPANGRKNLNISMDSYVIKIMIDPTTKVTEGVIFSKNGQLYVARVNKEVIVSGGTFGSAQLLMLSGIGPAKHLQDVGIPVIKDLPVGETLYDHTSFVGVYFSINYTEPYFGLRETIRQYLEGYGAYTVALNSQGLGFYKLNEWDTSTQRPDFELLFLPPNSTSVYTSRSFKFNNDTVNSFINTIDGQRSFNSYVIGLHPKSVGTVKLASKNPFDYPLIDARYLSDPGDEDIEVLYQGTQLLIKIANAPALQKYGAKLVPINLPACRDRKYLSKEYWYCVIRQLTSNLYHPVGTCRMGQDPKTSVVNHKLKVHGISKLRVADGSIFPTTVSGHTNAPIVMVGEKMSAIIKEEATEGSLEDSDLSF